MSEKRGVSVDPESAPIADTETSEANEADDAAVMTEQAAESQGEADTIPENGEDRGESEEEALSMRLDRAEAEAKANYDRFLRASAELENMKKRSQREMEALRKFANQSLIKDLLIVVDNLERAIASGENENGAASQLLEGVDMTLKEILKILEKFGVKPIEALENPFDPTLHEAVMQEEAADVPDNTVIKELQKGYRMHDRLLRPSMVVVSKS